MRAYLSYRYGDDASIIRSLLAKHDIEVFDSISDIKIGDSLQQAIKIAIRNSDFLVFIYSADNPNIAFEAGLAVALNKPIFSILAGGGEDTFLLDSTYVHATPVEEDKVKFSLELFLNNLFSKAPKKSVVAARPSKFYGGGDLIPRARYFDIVRHYNSTRNKLGSTLEVLFQEIFEANQVAVIKQSTFELKEREWKPDFSIWDDKLSVLFGNPIIIEIKRQITKSNLSSLLSNLESLKTSNPIGGVLIFYEELKAVKESELPATPSRLFIPIGKLVDLMETNNFSSAVIKFRNRLVHQ